LFIKFILRVAFDSHFKKIFVLLEKLVFLEQLLPFWILMRSDRLIIFESQLQAFNDNLLPGLTNSMACIILWRYRSNNMHFPRYYRHTIINRFQKQADFLPLPLRKDLEELHQQKVRLRMREQKTEISNHYRQGDSW